MLAYIHICTHNTNTHMYTHTFMLVYMQTYNI